MDNEIAIKVEHVSKTFKLPHEKQSSIKSVLINFGKNKKGYEKQQVLEDVSLEIKKGEFFGIVGRNGSGKSTLLKLLAGIYAPSEGTIQINGKLTPFIELGVGFNPELTGRENVFLNGALLGFSRKEMEAMYSDIVEFAELDRFMDQKLKNYSSGMQVRLAFSVAIRAETDILLIDEVLAVGDQSFQEKCYDYFSKIKGSGKTVIFVTHDMSSVERFCDRAYVLDKKKEANGLYKIPAAVALYNKLNHETTLLPADLKNRKKEGIFVKDIILFGDDKKRRSTFTQGEALHIKIDIGNTLEKPDDITIGLAFHDKDNVNLAGPNSQGQLVKSDIGSVEYIINKVPFNMGEYSMTVAILDDKSAKQFDLIDHGINFFVNTPRVHYGKVILDDHWNVV